MKKPTISVIMSVYNTQLSYLQDSVFSILNQTYKDFEFIIVDDASEIRIDKLIQDFNDKRIRLIRNEENIGLTKSLNKAIKLSRGKYIARMDADDISNKDRFELQVKYLEGNRDIGVLGTQAKTIGEKFFSMKHPTEHEKIKTHLMFNSALIHPSVMVRAEILKENLYDEKYIKGQDYELWSRLIWQTKFSNIDQPLLEYRVHSEQATQRERKSQSETANQVRKRMLSLLSKTYSEEEIKIFNNSINNSMVDIKSFLKLQILSESIIESNKKKQIYCENELKYLLSRNLDEAIFRYIRKYGIKLMRNIHLNDHIKNEFSKKRKIAFLYYLVDKFRVKRINI